MTDKLKNVSQPQDWKLIVEKEWPLARTQWTRKYLKMNVLTQSKTGECEGELVDATPGATTQCDYAASPPSHAGVSSSAPSNAAGSVERTGISFLAAPFTEDTEITGPIVLVVCLPALSRRLQYRRAQHPARGW